MKDVLRLSCCNRRILFYTAYSRKYPITFMTKYVPNMTLLRSAYYFLFLRSIYMFALRATASISDLRRINSENLSSILLSVEIVKNAIRLDCDFVHVFVMEKGDLLPEGESDSKINRPDFEQTLVDYEILIGLFLQLDKILELPGSSFPAFGGLLEMVLEYHGLYAKDYRISEILIGVVMEEALKSNKR